MLDQQPRKTRIGTTAAAAAAASAVAFVSPREFEREISVLKRESSFLLLIGLCCSSNGEVSSDNGFGGGGEDTGVEYLPMKSHLS